MEATKKQNSTPTNTAKNVQKNGLSARPPVVVVMGHIDHGKTKLLDTIRKTNVVAKESGGITQHIGAYEIVHLPSTGSGQAKKITFIDTPGHEAFDKMRSRGAAVADVAILVIAADEGIKPQTIEALKHIQEAGIPYIVAINKIDKPEANIDRIKTQLAEKEVLLEGWGGNIPFQPISAITGKGIPELLELILLVADLEELTADPSAQAKGIVIESHMDPQKGVVATLLIKDGVLKSGDFVVIGQIYGKIKSLEDFQGKSIKEATFSSPVLILGLPSVAPLGEKFLVIKDKKESEKLAGENTRLLLQTEDSKKEEKRAIEETKIGKEILNVILRSDVAGSKEALNRMVANLNFERIATKIVKSDVGDIDESDIKFSQATNSVIFGFKVKAPSAIQMMAENHKVKIVNADIIYELIDAIKEEMKSMLKPEIERNLIGKLSVLAFFKQVANGDQVIGGKVTSGIAKKGASIDVIKDDKKIGRGRLTRLQQDKAEASEVVQGRECGILFTPLEPKDTKIQVGCSLEFYEEKALPIELK